MEFKRACFESACACVAVVTKLLFDLTICCRLLSTHWVCWRAVFASLLTKSTSAGEKVLRLSHLEERVLRWRQGRWCCYGNARLVGRHRGCCQNCRPESLVGCHRVGYKEVACAAPRVAIKVGFKDAARLGLLFAIMASAFEGRLPIVVLAYFEKECHVDARLVAEEIPKCDRKYR